MLLHKVTIENFVRLVKKYDLIWIGEIHGIRENYKAYEIMISLLIENGFTVVAWEIQSDFNETINHTEDGRVNLYAISFLAWLREKIKKGKIEEVTYFGDIKKINGAFQNREERMAAQVVKVVKNRKSIVITGNFHMGGPLNVKMKIKPCLHFVKRETNLKILKVALTYAGGTLYNYGLKKFSKNFYFGAGDDLRFGTIIKREEKDTIFFHVGKAHAVFKNPSVS